MNDRDDSRWSGIGPWALTGIVLGVVLTLVAIHALTSFLNGMFSPLP